MSRSIHPESGTRYRYVPVRMLVPDKGSGSLELARVLSASHRIFVALARGTLVGFVLCCPLLSPQPRIPKSHTGCLPLKDINAARSTPNKHETNHRYYTSFDRNSTSPASTCSTVSQPCSGACCVESCIINSNPKRVGSLTSHFPKNPKRSPVAPARCCSPVH